MFCSWVLQGNLKPNWDASWQHGFHLCLLLKQQINGEAQKGFLGKKYWLPALHTYQNSTAGVSGFVRVQDLQVEQFIHIFKVPSNPYHSTILYMHAHMHMHICIYLHPRITRLFCPFRQGKVIFVAGEDHEASGRLCGFSTYFSGTSREACAVQPRKQNKTQNLTGQKEAGKPTRAVLRH